MIRPPSSLNAVPHVSPTRHRMISTVETRTALTLAAVVGDFEVQVIEHVERIVLSIANVARLFRVSALRHVATDGESARAVLLSFGILVAERDGHVVDDPVLLIVQNHSFHQTLEHLCRIASADEYRLRQTRWQSSVWRNSN